jgi:glycosyltransferase involved in cell wall biosynthesis
VADARPDRLIIAADDPLQDRAGGLQTLMRGFLGACPDPRRYAIAAPGWGVKGAWQARTYRDREFPYRRLAPPPLPLPNRLLVSGAVALDRKILSPFDAVYTHSPEILLPLIAARYPGRLVLHVIGNLRAEVSFARNPALRGGLVQRAYLSLSEFVMRRCHRILWTDAGQLAELPADIRAKSEVLGTFYDDSVFGVLSTRAVSCEVPRLLVVARLEPIKRVDLVLHALALAHAEGERWRLTVCGQGAAEADLRRLARDLSVDDVVDWRTSHETAEGLAALMRESAVGILVSEAEGSSTVVKEMLASGLPVVATGVGDNSLIIEDGATGAIVEASPEAIAAGISRALGLAAVAEKGPASVADHALSLWAHRLDGAFEP